MTRRLVDRPPAITYTVSFPFDGTRTVARCDLCGLEIRARATLEEQMRRHAIDHRLRPRDDSVEL